MRQLVNDQRIEIGITFGHRKHEAASVRLLWGDLVTDGVRDDVSRQWARRYRHDQRHFLGKNEVKASTDVIVCALGASNHALDITRERRQVVDFEMLAFGSQPR